MRDVARFCLGGAGFSLFIVLPVLLYLRRRRVGNWGLVLSILAMWVVWNLVHAPLHELSHLAAGWLAGQHAKDVRLIQHFWEGDLVRAYISWENGSRAQFMVSTPAPYVIDGLMVVVGFFLLRFERTLTPFAGALVLLLTFLRPIYDVATNYAADTVFGGAGDVGFLLSAYPPAVIHLAAWGLMLVAAAGAALSVRNAEPHLAR